MQRQKLTIPRRGVRPEPFGLRLRSPLRQRRDDDRGMTLAELMISLVLTSMLSVVLGGMVLAVQQARVHSEGVGEATMQAQSAGNRIHHMVSQAGIYKIEGQPTTLGLAVVSRTRSLYPLFDILVVWSGGRDGGMADLGVQKQLPLVSELLIYSLDPSDSSRLVEINFPSDNTSIDFRDAAFSSTIITLADAGTGDEIVLCDRIRTSLAPPAGGDPEQTVGNVRFDLTLLPSDEQLDGQSSGVNAWLLLPWVQGIATADSGLRQANLRTEFQIEPRDGNPSKPEQQPMAIPYFGSVSYRYAYLP